MTSLPQVTVTKFIKAKRACVGSNVHVMTGPEGHDLTTIGTYLELVENEKIVFTWGKEGNAESIVTILLDDSEGGTLLTLTHTKLPEDWVEGHVAGWQSALRHMETFFQGDKT